MDNVKAAIIASYLVSTVGYFWLDYHVSKQVRTLADSLKEKPELLGLETKLFSNDVTQVIAVIGPFTYFAKRHYKSVVEKK